MLLLNYMFLRRYKFYPVDTGGYVIMDDVFDIQLAVIGNPILAEKITNALNDVDIEFPDEVTKIH